MTTSCRETRVPAGTVGEAMHVANCVVLSDPWVRSPDGLVATVRRVEVVDPDRVRGMEFTARRIVTGHDAEGRDVILSDGPPPGTIEANGFGLPHWLWLGGVPRRGVHGAARSGRVRFRGRACAGEGQR